MLSAECRLNNAPDLQCSLSNKNDLGGQIGILMVIVREKFSTKKKGNGIFPQNTLKVHNVLFHMTYAIYVPVS